MGKLDESVGKLDFFAKLTDPGTASRRTFLQWSGATVAVLGAACVDSGSTTGPELVPGDPDFFRVDLGSGDVGVLNYAFALEQLEAYFYSLVVTNPYTGMTDFELRTLTEIRDHEIAHREFLRAALGSAAIPNLFPEFKTLDLRSRTAVLAVAQTFEDLGVAAYNGAGQLLTTPDYLLAAGKIVSVEARHATAIRDMQQRFSAYSLASELVGSDGLDDAKTPAQVLTAAAPYLNHTFVATGLPTS